MTPTCNPVVNTQLTQMNGLQRTAESFRYVLLCVEHWISPEGSIRHWLLVNCRLCAWLLIPALIILPVVGLILWQLAFWWSLFTGFVGKVISLLLLFIVLRTIKR